MLPPQLQGLPVPITCDAGPAQFGSHSHKDPGRDPSAFEAESLRCHNVYRARHGARALTWSRMLSNSAKRWAEVLRRMRCIHHSCRNIKRVTIGENIAVVHTNVPHLCHFTQMVWCSSQQFGIGQATTSDGHSLIVVAHYYPAGNIEGQYSINVLPPSRPETSIYITGNTTTTTTTTGTTTITTGNTTTTTGTTATTTGTTTTTTGNTTTTTGTTATTTGTTTTTTGTTKTITGITTNTITNTNDSTTSTTTTSTILPEQSNKHLRNLPQMKEAGTLLNPDQTPSKACQPAPTPHSPSVTHPQPLAVFIKDCVETHNKYRLRHKSPPLLLLETLGKLAQEWADSVAQESHMGHSNYQYMGQHIGQNILFRWKRQGVSLTGSEVCDIWYSQIKNFDFSQ
ncbi:uncharacterized protein LOC115222902 isoform X1, partial [Argonauta hians]